MMKKKDLCYKFVRLSMRIFFYPFSLLTKAVNKTYNGMSYLSYVLLKFECRDDDIFIATYPKAETTLLQMMLYLITRKRDNNFQHIESVAPWFEETEYHIDYSTAQVPVSDNLSRASRSNDYLYVDPVYSDGHPA